MKLIRLIIVAACLPVLTFTAGAAPTKIIFDTDMGNDIDDALALGVIHALQSDGECELLAVTITKDNPWAAPFVDLVNTFYSRGDIPVGIVRNGKTPEESKYITEPARATDDGKPRYPHDLISGKDAPEAVALLRKTLAAQPDGSVVMVQVGLSTNFARLLDSKPDEFSPLAGRELVKQKCNLLSIMAGSFIDQPGREYNVFCDLAAARTVFADWPTPIVASGFEIGNAILYPAASIEKDYAYVPHHPLREAYELYMKMPYDRPCWDLTSVLYAVRPAGGYFDLSAPGEVTVDEKEITRFKPDPAGRVRHLVASPQQLALVRETIIKLASQPPGTKLATTPATRAAAIDSFQGDYRFLSNFFPAEVEFEGLQYPSVEHAYQSAKTRDMDERKKIAALKTPAEAKAAGRALGAKQRADWDQVKFDVMETCVRYKFAHNPELRAKLLATGDVELIEGNTWGDQIWGVYQGKGENRLGKILMKVRGELQAASK